LCRACWTFVLFLEARKRRASFLRRDGTVWAPTKTVSSDRLAAEITARTAGSGGEHYAITAEFGMGAASYHASTRLDARGRGRLKDYRLSRKESPSRRVHHRQADARSRSTLHRWLEIVTLGLFCRRPSAENVYKIYAKVIKTERIGSILNPRLKSL